MPDDDTYRGMLAAAARFASSRARVGPSAVQRHLRVGFARAARICGDLLDAGLLGTPSPSGWYPVTGSPEAFEAFTRGHEGVKGAEHGPHAQ